MRRPLHPSLTGIAAENDLGRKQMKRNQPSARRRLNKYDQMFCQEEEKREKQARDSRKHVQSLFLSALLVASLDRTVSNPSPLSWAHES